MFYCWVANYYTPGHTRPQDLLLPHSLRASGLRAQLRVSGGGDGGHSRAAFSSGGSTWEESNATHLGCGQRWLPCRRMTGPPLLTGCHPEAAFRSWGPQEVHATWHPPRAVPCLLLGDQQQSPILVRLPP